MKKLFTIICITLVVITNAQNTNGNTELIEFTDENAKFTVPKGKTWHIMNVFDETSYQSQGEKEKTVIKFKSINGVIFKRGPILFYYSSALIMPFPIVLKEETSFEFSVKNSGGKAIMTYIEFDN